MRKYESVVSSRYSDYYQKTHLVGSNQRIKQYKIDYEFVTHHIKSGILCDVGCGGGEFTFNFVDHFELYGIEIDEIAKKVASKHVSFKKNIFTEIAYFDLVIFRGTIQHVDIPFQMIKLSFDSLKPGGLVVFLATPNTESIVYRLKKNLPFIDQHYNFYLPGESSFINVLENFGFEIVSVRKPYWNTPYRKFLLDHLRFLLNILIPFVYFKHAFWGNSMDIVAKKPVPEF
jgi:SAM-dependent methyltransferase